MNLLKDSSIFLMNVLYDSVKRKLILVTPGTQRVNGLFIYQNSLLTD